MLINGVEVMGRPGLVQRSDRALTKALETFAPSTFFVDRFAAELEHWRVVSAEHLLAPAPRPLPTDKGTVDDHWLDPKHAFPRAIEGVAGQPDAPV